MKSVVFLVSSMVIGFVAYKVHHNKKLKEELYMSLREMNSRIEILCEREQTPELVNNLPQSRSPSLSPVNTDCSSRGSYTIVSSEIDL